MKISPRSTWYKVSAKCEVCNGWFPAKCHKSGYVMPKSCPTCNKQHRAAQSLKGKQKKLESAPSIQVNGCTLLKTDLAGRCNEWLQGRCDEAHYLMCLDAAAQHHWPGWTRITQGGAPRNARNAGATKHFKPTERGSHW
jgi:hypothetical protein